MTKPSLDIRSSRSNRKKNLAFQKSPKKAAGAKVNGSMVAANKGTTGKSVNKNLSAFKGLDKSTVLYMHSMMVKSRVLEERLIKIYRAGESYFWIGGPGEEAFGVPLGMLVNKGQGLAHDFLHLHYRCTPTLIAMGLTMVDAIRLMMNRATDPSTGGRNFSGHYCFPKWNVAPVTSPIEVQYPIACGTAHAQKRSGHQSLTVVTGGDAGTAEGDFASSLILASRKGSELPLLMTVQNNKWGISTSFDGQHGEKFIADRAKAFQIKARVMNGNDPIESYLCIKEDMEYIRKTGKPAFIEALVSRLYGHSSASGANPVEGEVDPVKVFEEKILREDLLTANEVKEIWRAFEEEGMKASEQARTEPVPQSSSVWDHTYVGSENADWRKF